MWSPLAFSNRRFILVFSIGNSVLIETTISWGCDIRCEIELLMKIS